MVNIDVFKKETEQFLQEIGKAKLDILILQRQNETLCQENNIKIGGLGDIIESIEKELELNLKASGEKKIETLTGWCSFRVMPDSWEYDVPKLINWAKDDDDRRMRYLKVIEEFRKDQLKKDYASGLIGHDDICDEGLTIKPQEPKFGYKIKGGI